MGVPGRAGGGTSTGGTVDVVPVGSLVCVWLGVAGSSVVVGAGSVVGEDVGPLLSMGGPGSASDVGTPGAGAPAAAGGAAVCDVREDVVGRLVRADVVPAACSSWLVVVAQPSSIPARVGAADVVGADVLVPADALVVRSTGAPGPDERTTAVRTAAPSAALPAATLHQSRRGDRRTACRGLIGGLPARPVPSGAPRPPDAPVR